MYNLQDKAGGNRVMEAGLFTWSNLESDLVDWWMTQAESQVTLCTTEGEHVVVVDAGMRNDGPGPDISSCHAIVGDFEHCGSVEMHWHARDWYSHNHHRDPRYADVILHVVMNPQGGPSLTTVAIPPDQLGGKVCLANRLLSAPEIVEVARSRLRRKTHHLAQLAETGFSPLMLGMVEVIYTGKLRHLHLQRLAVKLGLPQWPDGQPWRGSNQALRREVSRSKLLESVLKHTDLFQVDNWQIDLPINWVNWRTQFRSLLDIGLSESQVREWITNVLAPYLPEKVGLEFWEKTAVFRHYGVEKRMKPRFGLKQIETLAEQQAVLEWQIRLCGPKHCSICPLVHSIRS